MKAILLILVIIYWIIIGIIFYPGVSNPVIDQGYTYNGNISGIGNPETPPTGDFLTDIVKLLGIAILSIGLPAGTPIFFQIIFTCITILVDAVFIIGLIA